MILIPCNHTSCLLCRAARAGPCFLNCTALDQDLCVHISERVFQDLSGRKVAEMNGVRQV